MTTPSTTNTIRNVAEQPMQAPIACRKTLATPTHKKIEDVANTALGLCFVSYLAGSYYWENKPLTYISLGGMLVFSVTRICTMFIGMGKEFKVYMTKKNN